MTKEEKLEKLQSIINDLDEVWSKIDEIPANDQTASELLIERAMGHVTTAVGQFRRAKSYVNQDN